MKLLTATWVPGHPRTKGSLELVNAGGRTKTGARRAPALQDSDASRTWLLLTVGRVREDLRRRAPYHRPSTEPIYARMAFWIPPYHRIAESGIDELAAAAWERAGDVDKLARNVLDALSAPDADTETARRKRAGVYADDVQVQTMNVERYAASDFSPPGCALEIYELTTSEVVGARRRAADWCRAFRGEYS